MHTSLRIPSHRLINKKKKNYVLLEVEPNKFTKKQSKTGENKKGSSVLLLGAGLVKSREK